MLYANKEIVDRIRKLRDEKGVRNADLAEACGVSQQAVGQWFKTGRIHRKHFAKLATLLGVSLEYLMTGKGQSDVLVIEDQQERYLVEAFRDLQDDEKAEAIRDIENAKRALERILKRSNERGD